MGGYVIDERLATGGTADVFLAHPSSGESPAKQVVIKRLLSSLRADQGSREAFAEEAALHQLFRHPNIVECYELAYLEGEPFLVMELVLGADLHRVMRVAQARRRPIAPPLACFIAREMLAGLGVVHAATASDGSPLGIVHRDVSPSNIYLSTDGYVKLGDFGIAKPASARTPRAGSLGSAIKGKFAYLAPEQVASEAIDSRADLFAVANILSEMMLARPLFPGSGQLAVLLSIRDVRIDALDGPSPIPFPLIQTLKRALSRDPIKRFPTADAFADALRPFSLHDVATARREIAQLVRWARETSMEMRAVGEHPDQRGAAAALISRPQPSIRLDSSILRDDSGPHKPVQLVSPPEPSPQPASPSDNVTAEFTPLPSQVRTSDGRLLGPFPYAKLVELVVTGRLSSEDEIDFMGTGFVPLSEIDELARHLAPRSTVTKQLQGPGAPDWHGFAAERYDEDIGGAIEPGIATALSYIASREASGVLIAQQGSRRKEIYVDLGRIHHVASSEATEMLGEYLVARGLLERGDLDFALAVLPRFDGHLGEALTGLGLLDAVAMFGAIQGQGRDKIVDVFTWNDGELSFYRDARAGKVEFPLDLLIGPIVEAGVHTMLDDVHAQARYKPWLERKLRISEASPSLRSAGWSPRVMQVVAMIERPVIVRTLLRNLTADGAGEHEAIRAIESARLARMLDWHL
jgi:eukaryotic-like serine/threonine-protein kinase